MAKRYNLVLSETVMERLYEIAEERSSTVKEVLDSFIRLGLVLYKQKADIRIVEGKVQYKLLIV